MASRVTSDNQVRTPQGVLDQLGIGPGSEVDFRRAADGTIVLEKVDTARKPGDLAELRGIAGPGLSTDEIMAMTRE